jgi:hypothetical protein
MKICLRDDLELLDIFNLEYIIPNILIRALWKNDLEHFPLTSNASSRFPLPVYDPMHIAFLEQ